MCALCVLLGLHFFIPHMHMSRSKGSFCFSAMKSHHYFPPFCVCVHVCLGLWMAACTELPYLWQSATVFPCGRSTWLTLSSSLQIAGKCRNTHTQMQTPPPTHNLSLSIFHLMSLISVCSFSSSCQFEIFSLFWFWRSVLTSIARLSVLGEGSLLCGSP